jgi:hypothetical protein
MRNFATFGELSSLTRYTLYVAAEFDLFGKQSITSGAILRTLIGKVEFVFAS